jgi:hypothetical protein
VTASAADRRRPRSLRFWLATFALISLVLGFSIIALSTFACACSPSSPPTDLPASPVVGVVVAIDQVSLTEVNSFDVRMSDGKTVTLKVGALDNATQFSLSHLATHMATGVPIRAYYRLENGEPVVYHLEDAVPASPSPVAT